jgi:RNA polymerase sigma-70 factor (ECF subfamily)
VLAFAAMGDDRTSEATVPDEADLVRSLRDDDPAAFEALVRHFGGRLLAATRRILRHEEDARDAVQEAFVSAFRSRKQFTGAARVSTWLHRIAINAALMKLRSRRRRPEEAIDDLLPTFREDGHHAESFGSWTEATDDVLVREETCAYVREAVARLPDQYREVIVLRDFEGLDTEETAAALGITPNAAKIRLHRARLALRTLVAPRFQGGPL